MSDPPTLDRNEYQHPHSTSLIVIPGDFQTAKTRLDDVRLESLTYAGEARKSLDSRHHSSESDDAATAARLPAGYLLPSTLWSCRRGNRSRAR